MGRRKDNALRDLLEIGALLPWWAALVLAVLSYVILASVAGIDVPVPVGTSGLSETVPRTVLKAIAGIGQYLVPGLLLVGAAVGIAKRGLRARLLGRVMGSRGSHELRSLTWQQFEALCHEMFRRKGYSVTETRKGADGGIDLNLRKDGERAVVQCKHWKAKKVGVNILREQLGIMTAESIPRGFVVTSGAFTEDARTFAQGKPITLIDGDALGRSIDSADKLPSLDIKSPPLEPECPTCAGRMVKRTAHRGSNAGRQFWGCADFPGCRGTRPLQ